MSDARRPEVEDKASQTDVSAYVQTFSLDRITKTSDSQGITINFYSSSYTLKSDKRVQTDSSCTELVPELPKTSDSRSKKLGNLACESREIRSFDYTPTFQKKSVVTSFESRQIKLMTSRKYSDGKSTGKTGPDLERKKLELELKATEEIARIQQTIIEKRLALELASLQDGNDGHHRNITPKHSMHNADMRVIEELTKKQNKMEQDLNTIDYQIRMQPPRPPPPTRGGSASGMPKGSIGVCPLAEVRPGEADGFEMGSPAVKGTGKGRFIAQEFRSAVPADALCDHSVSSSIRNGFDSRKSVVSRERSESSRNSRGADVLDDMKPAEYVHLAVDPVTYEPSTRPQLLPTSHFGSSGSSTIPNSISTVLGALTNDGPKINNLKADSGYLTQASSDLNPLRHLIEKKIDRRSSRTSDTKQSPPPTNSNSYDRKHHDTRSSRSKNSGYPLPDEPGCSPQSMRRYRTRSLWKSAMTKIKKKIKHPPKSPVPWK